MGSAVAFTLVARSARRSMSSSSMCSVRPSESHGGLPRRRPQIGAALHLQVLRALKPFLKEHGDAEQLAREGMSSADPNGWVQYLISLAWDVATLIHAGEPPDELIDRLRDRDNFQGARYELAIAAIFARLDCSIEWLDPDPALRKVKRVEFEASHRPTGQRFAVEAKSRHRAGVLQPARDRRFGRSRAR